MGGFREPGGFFDFFSEIPVFIRLFIGFIFLVVISVFAYVIIKGLRIWLSNNASELEIRMGTAVVKRTEVWGGSGESRANTDYFVTFEFEDFNRKELQVSGQTYGMIAEGDRGELRFQGTRFKAFNRSIAGRGMN
ncbi:DUF2500 domain-containing protein [Paenibacillus graminis]|uniref:DUF2500 domain-containing protein n=1 Tax=Paenibacillus graminis TaxID=189425 RepID=UPI000470F32C|nr:DUF2500 domain-containing protein [Paenibacillus graminis]